MSESALREHFDPETASFLKKKDRLLQSFGTPIEALLYADLFSPNLIEVDGSVILGDNVSDAAETFRARKFETKLSLSELEASFNFVEVAYLFVPGAENNDTIENKLAEIMAASWQAKLRFLYPSRTFSVSVLAPSETGSVVGVEFYEIRKSINP